MKTWWAWALAAVAATAAVAEPGDRFYLRHEASGRLFGPYAYADGTAVGEGAGRYAITAADAVHFSLKSERTGKVYGPFAFAEGSAVTLDGGVLRVVRERPGVQGTLTHPGLRPDRATVRLVPLDVETLKEYYQLVMRFRALARQHEARTAPIRVGPVVSGPIGHNRTGLVDRSEKDIAKSQASVDRQARPALAKFLDERTRQTAQVASGGSFAFPNLERGEYLVVAEASALGGAGGGELVRPVYWWTHVLVDGTEPVAADCDAAAAIEWPELFQRVAAVDESLGIRVRK